MKGLAFALDPDGYWIEIVRRNVGVFNPTSEEYNLSQTMLRVKNGPLSVEFYSKHLGMTLIRQMDFPQWKFSLYFLVSATEEELRAAFDAQSDEVKAEAGGSWEAFDPTKPNEMSKTLWNVCLELTYNHGTEFDPDFKVHNGNSEPYGFRSVAFTVNDLTGACDALANTGVTFVERPGKEGTPSPALAGTATARDPDGYWVQLLDCKASFAGVASNY